MEILNFINYILNFYFVKKVFFFIKLTIKFKVLKNTLSIQSFVTF